jgi:hypothetical protein
MWLFQLMVWGAFLLLLLPMLAATMMVRLMTPPPPPTEFRLVGHLFLSNQCSS